MKLSMGCPNGIDYQIFNSPYTGLATMILVQADLDLKTLGGQDKLYRYDSTIHRDEIMSFLNSDWAEFLAESVGMGRKELDQYTATIAG